MILSKNKPIHDIRRMLPAGWWNAVLVLFMFSIYALLGRYEEGCQARIAKLELARDSILVRGSGVGRGASEARLSRYAVLSQADALVRQRGVRLMALQGPEMVLSKMTLSAMHASLQGVSTLRQLNGLVSLFPRANVGQMTLEQASVVSPRLSSSSFSSSMMPFDLSWLETRGGTHEGVSNDH